MKPNGLILLSCAAALAGAARADSLSTLPDSIDLPTAVHYALDHSYPIREAREQIRQQEGVILQVKSQGIPNVGATGLYQRNAAAVSTFFPPETTFWDIQVKATQAIYAGGGIEASVKGARLSRDAALLSLQAVVNAALLDVRTKFYSVILAREQVKVQEDNVKLAERELQDTQNQFHAGAVSNFEVLRARVALANAQPDLITARNNERIAIEQLRQALGVPSGIGATGSFTSVQGGLDATPETIGTDAALASAHQNRPELLELGKLHEAAEQSVVVAKSSYYPTLSAFGAYEWGGENFNATSTAAGGSGTANGWLAGLQSTWSIFDGRSTEGKVQQAAAVASQQQLAYDAEELAIDVEVRQALSSLQEAAELVDASRQTVDEAAEALRLARERYHAGSATQLDVLTSETSLTQTRTNQLQANYNYLVAVATLRKAMGLADAQIRN
jgi:outer membrane protein TolC